MQENQPTTRQIVIFTVVLSFIVSVIGSVLTMGVFGGIFGVSEGADNPFVFNRPKILERILETQTSEAVVRQDELVVKVVEGASPAVVSIVASKDIPVVERYFAEDPFLREFFGEGFLVPRERQRGTERQEVSAGSGFLVSNEGLILTNKHVVADTEADYTVFFNDGSKKAAKVLARDPLQDLAVLKIEGSNYPFLKLSGSRIKIGQTAIAIGNALGEFRNTISVGVISGLQRSIVAFGSRQGPESLDELIQTDAAINPGNSGGPLLGLSGEVVGINTAVAQGAENIGFAIPASKAARALESVRSLGKILYPYLGVRYVVVTKDLAEEKKLGKDYGVLVSGSDGNTAIIPGGPADKAGIKPGDLILELNGERIDENNTLASVIQKHKIGDEVSLKIFRDGREIELRTRLEERR